MRKLLLFVVNLIVALNALAFDVYGISYNITSETDRTVEVVHNEDYIGDILILETVDYNGKTYRVTSIGAEAFEFCSEITSVSLPEGLTYIGFAAFADCSSLTDVWLPNSITYIGDFAFEYCGGLKEVRLGRDLKQVGMYAFDHCDGLRSLTIPYSLTEIGKCAFNACSGLESITVDSRNPNYDSRGDCNALIEKSTQTIICGCKNTVIPNSVTAIGDGAFCECKGLTTITIPNNIISIGSSAFDSCKGLRGVTIGTDIKSIGAGAFTHTSLEGLRVEANVPPVCGGDIVSANAYKTVYLETLNDSYATADIWKKFINLHPTTVEGIKTNGVSNVEPTEYYDLNGVRYGEPQRGINIVRYSDGTTKKIRVK